MVEKIGTGETALLKMLVAMFGPLIQQIIAAILASALSKTEQKALIKQLKAK